MSPVLLQLWRISLFFPTQLLLILLISFDLNKPEKIEIDIITRWGQILHQVKSSDTLEIGRHHYHLDISEDPPAIYFGWVITPDDTVQFHYEKE